MLRELNMLKKPDINKPHITKAERIADLLGAIEAILEAESLEQAQAIARAHQWHDRRFAKPSERSYIRAKIAELIEKPAEL
jgi:acyl-CoA reductase-like NAD-dependent aldehyde dehydrogenase